MFDLYQSRILAYGDILGWTEACEKQSDHARVKKAIDHIHDYAKNFSFHIKEKLQTSVGSKVPLQEYLDIEFAVFSDLFAVSMPESHGYRIFDILSNICHPLLCSDFLTRGGITVGELHHVENVILGPALIEAHHLEQEAIYPRFLCSVKLLEYLSKISCPANYIVTDQLGRKIANLLAFSQQPQKDLMNSRWNLLGIYERVENQINNQSEPGREKKEEKWRYMRDVLNLMDPRSF